MTSRYGSQLLTERWLLAYGVGSAGRSGAPESVVTSLAGFERSGPSNASGPGFGGWRSVVTSLAGFASARPPQPPAGRTATPAAFKQRPAVSRHTPGAC